MLEFGKLSILPGSESIQDPLTTPGAGADDVEGRHLSADTRDLQTRSGGCAPYSSVYGKPMLDAVSVAISDSLSVVGERR